MCRIHAGAGGESSLAVPLLKGGRYLWLDSCGHKSYYGFLANLHLQGWLTRLRWKAAPMGRNSLRLLHFRECGQSLIETALVLPILLLLAFNAINFG